MYQAITLGLNQRDNMMNTKRFSEIANNSYEYARECRAMAVSLEDTERKAARAWHAIADRLFEAVEQADDMTEAKRLR